MREFTDERGIQWEVWAAKPTTTERRVLGDRRGLKRSTPERRLVDSKRIALDVELRRGWLVFRSKFERRRVSPVPEEWEAMSETQLSRLLRGSRLSGPTRRLIE